MTARVNRSRCAGCGACVDVCPTAAVRIDVVAVVDGRICASCGLCQEICPQFAIRVGPRKAGT